MIKSLHDMKIHQLVLNSEICRKFCGQPPCPQLVGYRYFICPAALAMEQHAYSGGKLRS